MAAAGYRIEPGAIVLAVRLTPRADRDAVEGLGVLADGRTVLRVRVRAVPEDGRANAALIELMARTFHRPKSAVEIVGGAAQRLKQVRVHGAPAELVSVAENWSEK